MTIAGAVVRADDVARLVLRARPDRGLRQSFDTGLKLAGRDARSRPGDVTPAVQPVHQGSASRGSLKIDADARRAPNLPPGQRRVGR
jgi:hypothetical protein